MLCLDCMTAETSPQLGAKAWELSSAASLEEAKYVDDPPWVWAGLLMSRFHESGHDLEAAAALLVKSS